MKPAVVEAWVWVLIYAGLLLLSVAAFLLDSAPMLRFGLRCVGGLATALGVLLIWLRSRMPP